MLEEIRGLNKDLRIDSVFSDDKLKTDLPPEAKIPSIFGQKVYIKGLNI
jgi:hypothetical protein